ncbi:MAG: exodeoxyribonuclease VII large subunit [Melioribacteraceae bacterium]|nr:exodeoxyribonuclease VII large subunit [Melioribacteraceae bacterium]
MDLFEKEETKILSVSQISSLIKKIVEETFSQVVVIGEISNFKAHYSGHWYFTLKDENAQISCTMWKGMNSYVFFTPQDGIKVVVTGRITVYPPRGNYQIEVRSMKPAGEGELQAAFEKLKRKLDSEGLFDTDHKKSIPKFPEKIGVATASDGAAFKDMISVAQRRFPLLEIILRPCKVQGEGASEDLAKAVEELNKLDIDLIIIGRGGGSLEDLWAFNEEIVARAIYNSRVPVISGIGHEIDFTISDFVADLRAPTPTAAMELATPNIDEIQSFIYEIDRIMNSRMDEIIRLQSDQIDSIMHSYGFRIPQNLIATKRQFLDNIYFRMDSSIKSVLQQWKNQVILLSRILESFDINKTLKRGFTLISQNSRLIKKSADLDKDKSFNIKFYDKMIEIKK